MPQGISLTCLHFSLLISHFSFVATRRSRHILRELLATENMEVQMLHRLTAVLAYVGYYAISVSETKLGCDFRYNGENVTDYGGIIGIHAIDRVCVHGICTAVFPLRGNNHHVAQGTRKKMGMV